jgi:hypothetical protein
MISSKTKRLLTSKMQFQRWKEQVERGRSDRVKHTIMNSWTYDQFLEAVANKEHVTTRTLQQWGMAASFQLTSPGFLLKLSVVWV